MSQDDQLSRFTERLEADEQRERAEREWVAALPTLDEPPWPEAAFTESGESTEVAEGAGLDSLAGTMPRLPAAVALPEPAPSAWLDAYVGYARAVSPMTPALFHESAALWLGALAIARRLVLPMAFGSVYPNLSVVWVARTTLYRKSTALDVAHRLAQDALGHLLAPGDATPEALLSDMAGREPTSFDELSEAEQAAWRLERDFPGQRGIILDEMSGLLASFGRDYNAGLLEALLRFYDCTTRYVRSTRGQGRVTVRNAYLSILGASTPAALGPHLGAERLWACGWWPRFALLCPDGPPEWRRPTAGERPALLAGSLWQLYERLPRPTYPETPDALTVMLGEEVLAAWERYNRVLSHDFLLGDTLDQRLCGTYGRLPVQALKVSTILAALDWDAGQRTPRIELGHLARAVRIAEAWRASAHRVLDSMDARAEDALHERVVRQVAGAAPEGITLRDLGRALRDRSPGEVERCVQELLRVNELEVARSAPGSRGGRPTKRYRIAQG